MGDMAEKRRWTKSPYQLKQEVQKFQNFCHTVCAAPVLNVAPQDTHNLDEVPNSVFGFLRRNVCSLNDWETPNEVRKSPFTEQDFMRNKTNLLTIKCQEKNQPVCQLIKPFIIYQMKDNFRPSTAEKARGNKGVIVIFQKCGVIDTDWMVRNYLPNRGCAQQQRRFAMYDCATAHVTEAVNDGFARANISVAIIRGGLTAIVQSPDCDFIFVYRHHYQHVADEWACKNPNLKLTAAQRRIWGTHFTAVAYKHALAIVNIGDSFKKRGYIWPTSDGSHIIIIIISHDLRELSGYQHDANDALIWFRPKRALECENANEQRPTKNQAQASLMQLWKKEPIPDYWQSIRWHFLFYACVLGGP